MNFIDDQDEQDEQDEEEEESIKNKIYEIYNISEEESKNIHLLKNQDINTDKKVIVGKGDPP